MTSPVSNLDEWNAAVRASSPFTTTDTLCAPTRAVSERSARGRSFMAAAGQENCERAEESGIRAQSTGPLYSKVEATDVQYSVFGSKLACIRSSRNKCTVRAAFLLIARRGDNTGTSCISSVVEQTKIPDRSGVALLCEPHSMYPQCGKARMQQTQRSSSHDRVGQVSS
jgi:hypothetical protein